MSDGISDTHGLKTAVSQLHNPHAPLPGADQSVQEALPLPLSEADTLPVLEKNAFQISATRGPGRPKGAINRNTKELREYLLSRHRHPAEVLAEAYSRPLEVMARELNCSKLDAYKIQQGAAEALLPYVAQKMPQAIEAGENGLIQLFINGVSESAPALESGAESTIKIIPSQMAENSHFEPIENANSNASASNETPTNGENPPQSEDKTC